MGRRRSTRCGPIGPPSSCSTLQLPDISGLDLAEQLAAAPGGPAVVLTSTRDASDFGDRVARSGARGFVPKSALSGDAVAALLT